MQITFSSFSQVSFWHRLLFSNLWLFSGFIASEMDQNRAMRSFVRTTTAVTKFNSGIKVFLYFKISATY